MLDNNAKIQIVMSIPPQINLVAGNNSAAVIQLKETQAIKMQSAAHGYSGKGVVIKNPDDIQGFINSLNQGLD